MSHDESPLPTIDPCAAAHHNERVNVNTRETLERRETPYGSVGVVHDGADLQAWWIWKDDEEIDATWSVMERDDLLYVIEGTLRLELEGEEPRDLATGDCFVVPAGRRFRGYRWPRNGPPCLFLAVSATGTRPSETASRRSRSTRMPGPA
jgi:mannose-6-phosphate isomerase-like protein (cupin superfamily)